MKKTISIILAALAAAFAFVSCEKEEEEISIKYFVVGFIEPAHAHPHNISIYEYNKDGEKLMKRSLPKINHNEVYEYNSAPGMQNIVIYFTDIDGINFYKSIQNNISDRQSVVISEGRAIKITKEEFLNYTLNN